MRFLSLVFTAILLPSVLFAGDPQFPSEPEKVQMKNIDLDLQVDVEKQTLFGTAILTLDRKDSSANLILDSKNLKIEKIETKNSNGKWT